MICTFGFGCLSASSQHLSTKVSIPRNSFIGSGVTIIVSLVSVVLGSWKKRFVLSVERGR